MYHTPGLVLSSRGVGEANSLFTIFTRELGMIEASAQAVREVKSKLRFSLRDFSLSELSLVRGKQGWKITSAVLDSNFSDTFGPGSSALRLAARISSLLQRLVAGEEKNGHLFDMVAMALRFVAAAALTEEELANTECILVLAILHELGYLQDESAFRPFIGDISWSRELVQSAAPLRLKIVAQINTSLRESQM